jgi:hypothetical protein
MQAVIRITGLKKYPGGLETLCYNRKFYFTLIWMMGLLFLLPVSAQAASVTLSWAQPNCPEVAGYRIYYGPRGTNFKAWPKIAISSSSQTQCVITDLIPGETYAFAATSVGTRGDESDFSETLYYRVPDTDTSANFAALQGVMKLLLSH